MEIENLKVKLNDFAPDLVLSSPLKRCVKLAMSTFKVTPVLIKGLKEIDYGDWEGKKWIDINVPGGNLWVYQNSDSQPPNGESLNMLKSRVVEQLELLLNYPESKLAVVCHGGVIRSIISHFLNTSVEFTRSYHIHYTGFVRFEKTIEGWRLTEFNS